MQVVVDNVEQSTAFVIAAFLAALLLSFRKTRHQELFPVSVTQELKGLGMLSIVFAHISYMLVTDNRFLYPLSIAAGVGVDLFLFMSGYGLTVGMLKKPMPALEFFQRRITKVFIPFWLVLAILFIADPLLVDRHYSVNYMLQSLAGWFPTAIPTNDVNSPFWYITWMLMFYVMYPFLFMRERPWLTAIIMAVIANIVAITNPLNMQSNWLHSLHTNAFSLGILLAWWMQTQPGKIKTLQWFRNQSGGIGRYLVVGLAMVSAGYMAMHSNAADWPQIASLLESAGLDKGHVIGQTTSLLTMAALIILFSLKRLDNRLLYIFGVYSYETYLLHWPLMSRYDIFFQYLPAWAATIAWLIAFIGIGWLLQKITTPIGAWVDRLW
jgi:peptidoglycan/LPS O-acetylase OafA/YrhL